MPSILYAARRARTRSKRSSVSLLTPGVWSTFISSTTFYTSSLVERDGRQQASSPTIRTAARLAHKYGRPTLTLFLQPKTKFHRQPGRHRKSTLDAVAKGESRKIAVVRRADCARPRSDAFVAFAQEPASGPLRDRLVRVLLREVHAMTCEVEREDTLVEVRGAGGTVIAEGAVLEAHAASFSVQGERRHRKYIEIH